MPAKAVRELLSHNNNDPTHSMELYDKDPLGRKRRLLRCHSVLIAGSVTPLTPDGSCLFLS